MIITLTKDEVRICSYFAMERWLVKLESTDRPNYAKGKAEGKLEHELMSNLRANVCEWAVAKHFNISWTVPWYPNNLHTRRKSIPDVGVNGEVRSVRTSDGFPIWKKDADKIIYGARVLDTDNYTEIEIFKPFSANEYMKEEFFDSYIDGYRIPMYLLALN